MFLTVRLFVRSFHRSLGQSLVCLFVLLFNFTDNPPTLPGVEDNSVYVSTTNYQYHDDAEEFLHSEVLSQYGDLLVSFTRTFPTYLVPRFQSEASCKPL